MTLREPAETAADSLVALVGVSDEGNKSRDDRLDQIAAAIAGQTEAIRAAAVVNVVLPDTIGVIKGVDGIDGKDGAEGPAGPPGTDGEQGPQGDTGLAGLKGETGEKGDDGPPGPRGSRGDPGAKGEKGDTGDRGLRGYQGPSGFGGGGGPSLSVTDDGANPHSIDVLDVVAPLTVSFAGRIAHISGPSGGAGSQTLDETLALSPGEDIADALTGANAPDAGNVFATMADVGTGSQNLEDVLTVGNDGGGLEIVNPGVIRGLDDSGNNGAYLDVGNATGDTGGELEFAGGNSIGGHGGAAVRLLPGNDDDGKPGDGLLFGGNAAAGSDHDGGDIHLTGGDGDGAGEQGDVIGDVFEYKLAGVGFAFDGKDNVLPLAVTLIASSATAGSDADGGTLTLHAGLGDGAGVHGRASIRTDGSTGAIGEYLAPQGDGTLLYETLPGGGQTADIQDALDGAAAPSAANVFATMGDITGSGAPTGADYLVGTAHGGLSAEIVVGTSPGGELGGTWASPTVDATHSGSTHAAAQAAAEATAAAALAAHLADTSDAHDASAISFSPTGTISATDVQAAIAEVAAEAGGASSGSFLSIAKWM